MKHERLLINIAASVKDDSAIAARQTIRSIVAFLSKRGFASLEVSVSKVLKDLLGLDMDQTSLLTSNNEADGDDFDYEPRAYVSCVSRGSSLVFIDLESLPGKKSGKNRRTENFLELDIFSPSKSELKTLGDRMLSELSKCLKLPAPCETRRGPSLATQAIGRPLRKQLAFSPPIDERHYHLLVNPVGRALLRRLRKRGSVLARDVKELAGSGVTTSQAAKLLEDAAADGIGLVEKNYAIVCRKTQEIIFLLGDKQGVAKAKGLQCPKCSKNIGTEAVIPHFGVTEALNSLLDRSRWMPVFVKQHLIEFGVSPEDICTEVKFGEDEIDVLAFYGGRVLIFETKDRPINLNDAYALSARISRIESFLAKPLRNAAGGRIEDMPIDIVQEALDLRHARRRAVAASILPIVVSTQDIAKDARELLRGTRADSRFVENCERELNDFLQTFIEEIDARESRQRFLTLTDTGEDDSAGRLALRMIQTGFQNWRVAAWPTGTEEDLRRRDSEKPKR